MKIYLAATAPGNEEREKIKRRLLSYFLINNKVMECDKVFERIIKTKKMKIYLATWMLESSQGKVLTLVHKREREIT